MFRIVCDPSSGSRELYLTEIRSSSRMFILCLIGIWQCNYEPQNWCCIFSFKFWFTNFTFYRKFRPHVALPHFGYAPYIINVVLFSFQRNRLTQKDDVAVLMDCSLQKILHFDELNMRKNNTIHICTQHHPLMLRNFRFCNIGNSINSNTAA